MAEFKASDYSDIRKASADYDVARNEFQRLERQLNETSTKSKNYKTILANRNAAKQKMESTLKLYKDITAKRKKEFEDKQKRQQAEKKKKSIDAKLSSLQKDRQRVLDKGESTSVIDEAIKKAKNEKAKLEEAEKSKAEKAPPGRPSAVPASAKFNSVTGQWTLGNKKWDKNGKPITSTPQGPKTDSTKQVTKTGPTAPAVTPTTATAPVGPAEVKKSDQPDITETTLTGPSAREVDFARVLAQAQSQFGGIDEIFRTNEELRSLLIKAVGDPDKVGDEYTVERFISELENTNWFKSNAGPIRQRGFYKRQYEALEKNLKLDDPNYKEKLAELRRTSEWGRGLQNTIETVNEYVTQLLGVGAIDEATIASIASDIYSYANEDDAVKIRNAVLAAARYGKGAVIGGQNAEIMSELKAIAGANGFDLDKQFATELPTWLDRIAKGESIEVYKKIIRDSAKAAFNVSDRVSALMDQGVNLGTIYSPYRNVMASILELNPETVTLKDLADKGVFGAKEEMSLYDFQKVLRKDPRWQYTQNAREDVSNVTLQVLRDFGFQG